jgi:hypothetical protein
MALQLPTPPLGLTGGGVAVGVGGAGERWRTGGGGRISASLPRLTGADGGMMLERRGAGMRVSMRRMSWTLMACVSLSWKDHGSKTHLR